MKLLTFLFFSTFLHVSWPHRVIRKLRIQINDGEIVGRYIFSESGRSIRSFIGIPFAAPPIKDLRFRNPQKVTPWNNTLFTQIERPKCPQRGTLTGSTAIEGDEDCLYVNVYVPETSTNRKLDVIVFLYGGSFAKGHAGPSLYRPDYLVEHDIILVAGNYRLGALGFLSTEDSNCSGNFGLKIYWFLKSHGKSIIYLKDQAFLLQWVQDNIEHFGGDKNSVTIFGESAGAVSVAYQMISPMSTGLFHRAISSSGGLLGPAPSGAARKQAIRLAERMNCPTLDDTGEIIECLRQISPEDLIDAGVGSFSIVVESFDTDEPTFIEERNYNNRFAHFAEIPWLVGMNSEESLYRVGSTLDNPIAFYFLIANWDAALPRELGYSNLNVTAQKEITKSVNEFYFGSEEGPGWSDLDKQLIIDLATAYFLPFIEDVQRRLVEDNHTSTYLYLFTHRGKSSFSNSKQFYGTAHVDDLIPLFPFWKTVFNSTLPTKQDRQLSKVMSLMWANFARFGNPTPEGSVIPIWPPVTSSNFANMEYMQIGNENGKLKNKVLQVKRDYYSARAEFWQRIREDYGLNSWFE